MLYSVNNNFSLIQLKILYYKVGIIISKTFLKNKTFSNVKLNYIEGMKLDALQEMTERDCTKYAKLLGKEYKTVYAKGVIPKSVLVPYIKQVSFEPFARDKNDENDENDEND